MIWVGIFELTGVFDPQPFITTVSALNKITVLGQSVPLTLIQGSKYLGSFGIYTLLKEFHLLYIPGSLIPLLHNFPGPNFSLTIFRRLHHCCFWLLEKAPKPDPPRALEAVFMGPGSTMPPFPPHYSQDMCPC